MKTQSPKPPSISPLPSVAYPGPWGHIFLYWAVPGSGQSSHWWPQPRPPSQQHSDFVTRLRLLDAIWHMVCNTSAKHRPCRLSATNTRETRVKVKEPSAWFSVDSQALLLSHNLQHWKYSSYVSSLHLVIVRSCWPYTPMMLRPPTDD